MVTMMKRFKFTLFIVIVFILVFLSLRYSAENVNGITVSNIEEKGQHTYITGNISPIKAYKGYEYSSNNGKCYIKIYSSLRLFGGSNEYKIHVGNFDDIYFTDGKSDKKITKSKIVPAT